LHPSWLRGPSAARRGPRPARLPAPSRRCRAATAGSLSRRADQRVRPPPAASASTLAQCLLATGPSALAAFRHEAFAEGSAQGRERRRRSRSAACLTAHRTSRRSARSRTTPPAGGPLPRMPPSGRRRLTGASKRLADGSVDATAKKPGLVEPGRVGGGGVVGRASPCGRALLQVEQQPTRRRGSGPGMRPTSRAATVRAPRPGQGSTATCGLRCQAALRARSWRGGRGAAFAATRLGRSLWPTTPSSAR
jgi:hypothetical protein